MLSIFPKRASTQARVRLGRWMCTGLCLMSVAAGAFGAAFFASRIWLGSGTAALMFVLSLAAGTLLAQWFFQLDGWFEQKGRDLRAAGIWEALRTKQPVPEPFALYLRPFASTDQIEQAEDQIVPVMAQGLGPAHLIVTADRLEFEEQIERALRPIGVLVGLGRPLEHIGAGRITVTNEEWKLAISRLMDEAGIIVLLPSAVGGTIWEVDRILSSEHVHKTIVVDPPNARTSKEADYDHSAEWANIRAAFSRHGFNLPDDNPQGSLMWFGGARSPARVSGISLDGHDSVRRFARKILKENKRKRAKGVTSHA